MRRSRLKIEFEVLGISDVLGWFESTSIHSVMEETTRCMTDNPRVVPDKYLTTVPISNLLLDHSFVMLKEAVAFSCFQTRASVKIHRYIDTCPK